MISVTNLTAGYGARTILRDVSLEVLPGECVGLVGPSGSGKSTLLSVLVGELPYQSGSVDIAGWRPGGAGSRPPAGHIGMIYQDPVASLDPLWNIGRCIAEPLLAAGVLETSELVASAMKTVGLRHLNPRTKVPHLSVGQAQRVAIARATAAEPAVVIADEPTSALDPTNAASVVRRFHEMAKSGTSILIGSHNQCLLESFCSRILTIKTRPEGAAIVATNDEVIFGGSTDFTK
ncbi:ABC transporter ATP-binding protein [Dongia sp.]|uniref:ABC transporter ATP-binding protein n=1 Tax=Dongia sp. TaxID=1977262 RepID=UPI0035B1C20C